MPTMTTDTDLMSEGAKRAAEKMARLREAAKTWAPTGDNLLLCEEPREEQRFGGLIIPESDKRRGRVCRVIAAGPTATLALETRVVVGTYHGTVVDLGVDSALLLIREGDVLLVESPGDAGA